MRKCPKISIVTPTYNQGQFLEETILSVLNQCYPNLEYIIIDGGSVDNSVNIIKKYEDRLSYWVSERDSGQTCAINKGFKQSTGDAINWLNSDDMLVPGALRAVGEACMKFPKSEFWFGDFDVIDNKGQIMFSRKSPIFCYRQLLYGRQLSCQPAVFFRRHVLERIGFLDETFDFCMDIEFWIRAVRLRCEFQQLKKTLALARMHRETKTILHQDVLYEEHKSVLKKYDGLGLAEDSAIEDYYFTFLNRFWRLTAAANRFIFRGDCTFGKVGKVTEILKRAESHLH